MRELRDRVAVVTGGAHGIGRALAVECARQGMDVVVADIEPDSAQAVADEARGLGRRALAVPVDVTERVQVERLADAAYDEFGLVHLLFNNAGVSMHAKVAEARQEDWDWVFDVNLWGPLRGVLAFLPRMRAQDGEGHVVNTASMSGLIHRRNQRGVYQAAKHALVAMTNALRSELEEEGSNVSVSCFCPGGTVTDIENSGRHRQARFGGPVDLGEHPVPRQANPMLPEQVATRVLEGVRTNQRYIFSHPHLRSDLERHYQSVLDDFEVAAEIAARTG